MAKIFHVLKSAFVKKRNYLAKEKQLNVTHKWLGSNYGGFFVAIDYLDTKKNEPLIVYSAGVGKDISFDLKMIQRYKQAKVYAFDPTPISKEWLNKQSLPDRFHFYPVGIGAEDGFQKMYLPKAYSVSFTVYNWDAESKEEVEVEMRTIESIAKENNHTYIDVLKMDIEGSEFKVLEILNYSALHFGQILVEFHERFIDGGQEFKDAIIKKLEEEGYKCFAISSDYEYSFINEKLLGSAI